MADTDWSQFSPVNQPASGETDWSNFSPADAPKKQNKGIAADLVTDVKRGVQQLPGAVTGLVDIPVSLVTGSPLVSGLADKAGEITGFQPSKWAKSAEAEYSPSRQAGRAEVDNAWEQGTVSDIAGAYLKNPMNIVGSVAESIPSMLVGGLAGRAALGIGAKTVSAGAGGVGAALPGVIARTVGTSMAPAVGAGIGEGGIMAGQAMQNSLEAGVDPRTAAGYAGATGLIGGALGTLGGKVAQKFGVVDPETLIAGGIGRQASNATGMAAAKEVGKRVAGGAISEGLFEELPQSVFEQGFQNLAQDKPLTEGMARAGVEGALAGSFMGGAFNAIPGGRYAESKINAQAKPQDEQQPIAGLLPSPTYTGTPGSQIVENDAARQAAVDAADKNAADLYAMRDAFEAARQNVVLVADPVPVQQRIDAMLGLDTARMDKKGRALYEKDLAAAFNEQIGITHDANQREVPFTMGEYLDAQVKTDDAVRARERIPAQNANQQSVTRLGVLAEEEAQQQVALTQDLARSAAQGGALSKAALSGMATGATQMPVHPMRAAIEQQMLSDEAAQAELAPIQRQMQSRSTEQVRRIAENEKAIPKIRQAAIADLQRRMATQAQPTTTSPLQQTATRFDMPAQSGIKQLQAQLEQADPFSEQSGVLIEKLQSAVTQDAQSALSAGQMPVYKVTDQVSVAIHPSAQNPGMVQVTRYTKDGVIGDSQYNNVDEAVRQEGLTHKPRIASNEAAAVIEQSIQAEAGYQQRMAVAPATPESQKADNRAKLEKARAKNVGPQSRDDLVGAILRVTGGNGIHPKMAQTIVGDKANAATKVRGLFTLRGQEDLDDIAELLRIQENYDVRDGNHLAELVRQQAGGDPVYSMERVERDAAANVEKEYRDDIRRRAAELGIRTAVRKFDDVERDVLEAATKQAQDEERAERDAIQAEQAVEALDDDQINVLLEYAAQEDKEKGRYINDQWISNEQILDAFDGTETLEDPEDADGAARAGQADAGEAGGNRQERGDEAGFDLAAQTPEELRAKAEQERAAAAKAHREEVAAIRAESAAKNKAEKERRAAQVLAEREAAKKAEVDKDVEVFALGQNAPPPVVKKVTTEDARGQQDIVAQQQGNELVGAFTISKDGIEGKEIPASSVQNGSDAFQYALGKTEDDGATAIFRRKASERGTYGGWRWEADAQQKPAEPVAQPKQERGEVGASLTKEQRKSVLKTLADVYRQKNAPRESKGVDSNGNERSGYAYSPDLFEKSDITGAMVRYYVTLPDGRIAHPTELFADYTQSDIDAAMQKEIDAERASENSKKMRDEAIDRRSSKDLNAIRKKLSEQIRLGMRDVPDRFVEFYSDKEGKWFAVEDKEVADQYKEELAAKGYREVSTYSNEAGQNQRPIWKPKTYVGEVAQPKAEPAKAQEPAAKEPWQMTSAEFDAAKKRVHWPMVKEHGRIVPASKGVNAHFELNDDAPADIKTMNAVMNVSNHESAVSKAVREGKPVPANVLADYPDLQPKAVEPAKEPFDYDKAYQARLQYLEKRANQFGRERIRNDAKDGLAGIILGREFGESVEEFFARRPDNKAISDATKAWLDGEKPATVDAVKPAKSEPSEMDALKAEMGQAIGELASILGVKQNLTPEEESRIIPVMSKIFRIAAKMGYIKFKDAAKYVLGQIRQLAGNDVADKISIDNLQAGYINIAKEIGGDKREAMSYDSIEDLEKADATDQRSSTDLERDSRDAEVENGVGEEGVRDGRDGNGGTGRPGVQGGEESIRAGSGSELRGSEAAAAGERGDLEIYTGAPELSPGSAGNRVDLGSRDSGLAGPPVEPDATKAIGEAATKQSELVANKAEQARADKTVAHKGGIAAIRDALPILTEGQQEDVAKAETRFAVPDGYGMLFTNGTGTGKTFTGLGAIKRLANQGKTNILIVAPNDKIVEDWQKAGKLLGLDITRLADTNDAGNGIVITTSANMGQNNALASREWDLVVSDEAHYLAMGKDGANTNALKTLRAITLHPDGVHHRHSMLNAADIERLKQLDADAKMQRMSDDQRNWYAAEKTQADADKLRNELRAKQEAIKADVAERQGEKRPRALFLSATPFAYEKTVDWANGYLFDYNEGRSNEEREFRGYNEGSNLDQFMMQHFGYRMRYGKLTQPDAKVDSGLMQRQFNTWLKKKGSLSGRMLDVAADYDRRFILVDSAIGQRIDDALEWFESKRKVQRADAMEAGDRIGRADPYESALSAVRDQIGEKFDYLSRRYLLESIKAREVVPHVREHLAMGRKVVVFHDYKKGGGFNPFLLDERSVKDQEAVDATIQAAEWNRVVREFNAEFMDIINSDLFRQSSPIDMFKAEFPGVLLFNGDVPAKTRRDNVAKFQDDASGPQVILVQSAAGKEGISLHDTTGKHQRVLFNLGQPTQPTTAIQQEGRIYRTGQVTDAIFRYLNTGTNWEKWAFATTIAQRASAAENLGMGEQARALKDAFISGFEESADYRAGMEDEGKGGKARDKAANDALTEYDRARAFYFGTQKKNSKTKAQEGADYFATPEPVGLKMVEWADIRPGEKVLEPSAGHGAIARWIPDSAEKTAVEPSLTLRPRLAMVFDGQIIGSDFESLNVVNKYDAIVMNPPFGSGGKTAVEHLAKAATHLRDGGRIVALLPTGPAADKKFDKWMYEGEARQLKPLTTYTIDGKATPIYRGDTIESKAAWAPSGVVTRVFAAVGNNEPDIMVKATAPEFKGAETRMSAAQIKMIQPTGKRTGVFRPAEGIYMVADIKMPAVTFERAGTQVMTRIVVLEKQSDTTKAPNGGNKIDLSDIGDINELFKRVEYVGFQNRPKVDAQEADQAPANDRPQKAKPAAVGDVVTVNGSEYAIEIYTTNDGKEKRGIWMEEKEAKEINPRAFKSSKMRGTPAEGKFFVDEYWLNKRNGNSLMSRGNGTQTSAMPQQEAESRIKSILGDKLGKVLIDSGIVTLVDTEQGLRNLNGAKYMVAWHGSPHDHNKFDSSKIGTGEGAQAYGYGLYFAGSKEVAEYYKITLSNRDSGGYANAHLNAKNLVARFNGDAEYAIEIVSDQISVTEKNNPNYSRLEQTLNFLRSGDYAKPLTSAGRLYQVELAPSEDEYLDWDKPLSEQSEKVRDAILEAYFSSKQGSIKKDALAFGESYTGQDIYNSLANAEIKEAHIGNGGEYVPLPSGFNEKKATSDYLHSIGIRGIRYLDGSSRKAGEGNSNYVIFSDDDVTITAKYAKENGGIQGATFPDGRIALVLENLNANNFDGIFAHEGFHSTIRELVGEQTYTQMMKRLENMGAMGNARQWFKDAEAAIPSNTKAENRTEELAAYAVEQYTNGTKQPNVIRQWVESLLSALRTAIIRRLPFGKLKTWAVNNLQPQDLANLAIAGLRAKAQGQLQAQGREAMAYSRNEGVQSSYGLPNEQLGNRAFDRAEIRALRRLAAGMERPEAGITFRITDDGIAIATGPKGTRVPERYIRFANDNGLSFESRRLPISGGTEAPAMPAIYRTDGALYFGEMASNARPIDRTGKTRFSKINQTDTPEFKKWFGDSKVVDADGNPLVVYHATTYGDFNEFTKEEQRKGMAGFGFYFSDRYGSNVYAEHSQRFKMDRSWKGEPKQVNTMPVFLRMENPLLADNIADVANRFKDQGAFGVGRKVAGLSDDAKTAIQRAGYDGVITNEYVRKKRDGSLEIVSPHDKGAIKHPVYVVFEPTQVKSAIGNNGQFDGTNPDIRYSRAQIIGDSGRQYEPAQRQFFKNVGRDIEKKNLVERTTESLKNDFWKKMAVGIVDQFRGLRDLGDNGQAYMLARLSKGTAGAFDALLHHGKLSIRDGVYDADTSGGFIERLGTPLHGELDDFLWYVAANRAEGLSKVDRENLFTPTDIAAGKSLANGNTNFDYTIQTGAQKGTTTRNRATIYADANRVFNEFQKNTLDMAEQSGLIDGSSRKLWESEFYVPFYRVSEEDGEFIGSKMGNALVRQQAFKKLKGGTEKLNSDLLSNTLLNFSHLIEASAKNRAAKASLVAAEKIGAAHKATPGEKKTVWFMDNGKKIEYGVDDPFVMTAITSLEYAGMRNGIMDVMTKFKHWLTIGVTASPAFKVRNLIRDSIQSIGASELGYNPIKNIAEGYKQTKRDSQEYVSALASGGLIRFGTMLEGSESARVRQLVKAGVKDSTILNSENKWRAFYGQYLDPAVSAYNELGNRSEEINRAALYNQLVKQGKSHAEAALLARDLMDFSMQGSFNTIRFLTQVVPFMNARLQGMYKLGRSAKDNPRKLAVVTGAVALASIALMLAYGDDDDWKRREDWDRDNFWWFKFGDVEFRIPKPFEVGAIGTLAERGLELMIDDEMTGERFRNVVNSLVMNNLSMNPIPQAFKPILDLYANKDSFTKRPIESLGMQRLDPTERFNSNTSMVARGMSKASLGALSPVQIDHLARAYFGWLGSFVIGGADMVSRSVSDEPTKPALDYFRFGTQGILKEVGTGSSRYVTQVYEQAKEIEQAHATYRQMLKDGRMEEAKEYAEDNNDQLIRYRKVESVKKMESNLNERIRKIERSDMDSDQKKDAIALINKQKEQVAKRIAVGA